MIESFCKNTQQFLTANYICKNAPSLMFGIVLNTRDLGDTRTILTNDIVLSLFLILERYIKKIENILPVISHCSYH